LLPGWREIYYGLPRLIEQTRWLPELQQALAENGFREIRSEYLTAYGSAIVCALNSIDARRADPRQAR
jgi:demethylmenaquinone methyltransferase/2-methoxy-6-polyprenyl-1,4-benzoquinol methylase